MKSTGMVKNRSSIPRQGAENYLEITLLSFAASVSLTRLFLELTGYPKIGSGDLHIAHVLWGGLLLFIACLTMLIFANRWVYLLGSFLSGVGVGLFIDEVGKFITKNNDYFYPSAAPIIYAFFLMTVLVYFIIKRFDRKKKDARTTLYHVLEDMGEILDHDLSKSEKEMMINRLESVIEESDSQDICDLAIAIKTYLTTENIKLVEEIPHFWKRIYLYLHAWEVKWITRTRLKMIILVGLTILALRMVFYPMLIISLLNNPGELSKLLLGLINEHLVNNAVGLTWYQTRVGLEGSFGLILLLCIFLIIFKREKQGILIAYLSLIFSLTVVNLVIFYFNQFSAIIMSILQFIVLLLIINYKNRFIKN